MMTDFAFCKFLSNNVVKTYYLWAENLPIRAMFTRNDIVPLSYGSDFWNGIVDCLHRFGLLSYQFLGQHLETGGG